jgi:hypothetical protein
MRIAITTLNGRVSPLFDSASRLLVVALDMNRECSRFEIDVEWRILAECGDML